MNKKYCYWKVFTIKNIPIYLHWSASAILAGLALFAISSFGLSVIIGLSYFGLLLLHELGHAYFEWKRGYQPLFIILSAIHGKCIYKGLYNPEFSYDEAIIAWGGVLAQLIVFVPVNLWLLRFGGVPVPALNIILLIFGGYSTFLAIYNLIPITGLDGEKAWKLIPYLLNK